VERPVPAIGPGEALMRTRFSGICGSDLLDWYVRKKAGTVLGHEVSGEIVAVGEGVTRFRIGDRVAPHHHAPCLACAECAAGRHVHCAAWKASRLEPGGMAELVRIPEGNLAGDTRKVPDGVSDEEATFIEPLATVVKAFRRGVCPAVAPAWAGPAGSRPAGAARRLPDHRRRSRRIAALRRTRAARRDVDVDREPRRARRVDFVFAGPASARPSRAEAVPRRHPSASRWRRRGGLARPDPRLTSARSRSLPTRAVRTTRARPGVIAAAASGSGPGPHRFPIERAAEAFARARQPEGAMKVAIAFP
jgi:L-iditol 2-dehydrogenase